MTSYAHVINGAVVNIVEWDGTSPLSISDELVPASDEFQIGGMWDGSTFTPPPPDPEVAVRAARREAAKVSLANQMGITTEELDELDTYEVISALIAPQEDI